MLLLMLILGVAWIYFRSERSMDEKTQARNAAITSYQSASNRRTPLASTEIDPTLNRPKRAPSFGKR